MKRKICFLLVGLLIAMTAFAAGTAEQNKDKHTLAVSVPLTGKMAQYGISYRNAIQLAVDDFNARGGLNGKPVELLICDDAGVQAEAINMADLICENKDVFACIGSYGSSTSLVMAPIFQEAQIPFISPNTSHPSFFEIGDMMMPLSAKSDNCFYEVADVLATDYKPQSVVMIYQNNDSGVTIDDVFKVAFPEKGIKYASEPFVGGETSDFTPILSSLYTKNNPDMIIVCADYAQGSQVVIQAKQLGYDNCQMVGIASMFKPQVLDLTGAYGEGMILCGVQRIYTKEVIADNDFGAYCNDIIARYTKRFPEQAFDSPAALAYDAATLACEAAKAVGTDPKAMMKYMKELHSELASGEAWFDANGDFFRKVYTFKIENGKFVFIDK